MREAENQTGIAYADGDYDAKSIANQNRGQRKLWIRSRANDSLHAAFCLCHYQLSLVATQRDSRKAGSL